MGDGSGAGAGDGVYRLLELPSFQPVLDCSIPPNPAEQLQEAVAGIVNGKIIVCGGNIRTGNINNIYYNYNITRHPHCRILAHKCCLELSHT